jgi:hypothetical protein
MCWRAMTDPRSDRVQTMRTGIFPVLAWTLAYGVMGVSLYVSGVLNSPRTGPLWVALAGGALSWSLAGAFTFPAFKLEPSNRWNIAGFVIWALAFFLSFALVGFLVSRFEDTLSIFLIMCLGWSMGPGVGAFASTWLRTETGKLKRASLIAVIWTLGFFVGSYFSLVAIYLGPELAKIYVGPWIGETAALNLGFGLSSAAGGFVSSLIAVALTKLLTRFR